MLTRNDNVSVRFLKLILPEQGFYIAAIKNPKAKGFKPSIFAATIEELWAVIESADRDGYETYHACASFKEELNDPPNTPDGGKRLGRTKHNVLGAKSFWLDLDVGPKKKYSTQDAAISALKKFGATLSLPYPIIVESGWGLHVYWPVQQMLDRETWERHARGLKNLCRQHDLHVDQSRTADISSVLRTPGTHNRKYGTVREVSVDPDFLELGPYAIEQFKVFADHADAPWPRVEDVARPKFDPNGIFKSGNMPDLTHLAAKCLGGIEDDYPPFSGELIAVKCEQVRALRDRKGDLPEPLWYAGLGVLAFCEDGDKLGHEWSSGDARYTPRETQERLDRAQTLTGATTCQRFHDLNPTVCERCPHWGTIKSPIALARSTRLCKLFRLKHRLPLKIHDGNTREAIA
jgi:hypothetical protein